MHVGIVAGAVVPNDAISAAAASQADLLEGLAGVEQVTLFAHHITRKTSCTARAIENPWALASDPLFAACDFVIFHWGIHYDLFDALTLVAGERSARTAVHFHNCTPVGLVHESDRPLIERSIAQFAHAIGLGTPLWTYSEFNRRTLLDWGATDDQIEFVPFPIDVPGGLVMDRNPDQIGLVSVGRFVPAKCQHVLVEALNLVDVGLRRRIRLRMAGSGTYSDPAYMDAVGRLVTHYELGDIVTLLNDPSDDELWQLYASSHVVISTSLHEGLCVPIIEGYAVGCRAIGTTAGNLPFLVVPPDEVVPPSDPALLAAAIDRTVSTWQDQGPEYTKARSRIVHSFSTEVCRDRLRSVLFG